MLWINLCLSCRAAGGVPDESSPLADCPFFGQIWQLSVLYELIGCQVLTLCYRVQFGHFFDPEGFAAAGLCTTYLPMEDQGLVPTGKRGKALRAVPQAVPGLAAYGRFK